MMPLISIIIPIYNLEKYIERCLKSIQSQSLDDFEVIVVDDGSTDESLNICKQYAQKDSRIVIISQHNGGASKARNSGIAVARGQYIAFIDGDDYIEKDFLEKLYNAIRNSNYRMSMCGFDCVDECGNSVRSPFPQNYIPDSISGYDAAAYIGNTMPFGVVWNKLYDATIFKKIRFQEGKTFEDELILHHLYGECDSIACVKETLYHYVQRAGSKMTESYSPSKMDIIDAYMDRLLFFVDHSYEQSVIDRDRKKLMEFFRIAYRKKGGNTEQGKKKLHILFLQYKKQVYPLFITHTFEEWVFVHCPNITMQIKSICRRLVK